MYGFHLNQTGQAGHLVSTGDTIEQVIKYIDDMVKGFQKRGLPAISVDTKKKENIGNYANKGQKYHHKGQPQKVKVYDFIDKKLGKVAPCGIYDLSKNEGLVKL